MAITAHLITKNNQATLERTLQSLMPLGCKTLVADLGSKDATTKICTAYGAEVIKLSLNNDYSAVRNEMARRSKTEWNFYLEPWEALLEGHARLTDNPPGAYRFNVIQGDLVTKQTRLWHGKKSEFINPVYETLPGPAQDLPVYIYAGTVDRSQEMLDLIEVWKAKNPVLPDPYYYQACVFLGQKKWDAFLAAATHFLFLQKTPGMSRIMTKYYQSLVHCYVKRDYKTSVPPLVECLAEKPLMAEFWCLLGDIYYASKEYGRARSFYENALILGGNRKKEDDWPLEITKYKEHPTKMMDACDKMLKNTTVFKSQSR